ncbi:sulfur carrier protein ThiS [Zhihengliuella sp.]|uniref:sulfur carrier protein ThiS n=1 Tax=Zhihengliuella sp. TaxID=1954483 RepID=UPI00281159D7|nr:sulfur carrier protein ThiS [Zhihengliuella sp.]
MKVRINGRPAVLDDGATLRDAVALTIGRELDDAGNPRDGRRLGVAVAVDADVVPRSNWGRTAVVDGTDIEILTAVQGG